MGRDVVLVREEAMGFWRSVGISWEIKESRVFLA